MLILLLYCIVTAERRPEQAVSATTRTVVGAPSDDPKRRNVAFARRRHCGPRRLGGAQDASSFGTSIRRASSTPRGHTPRAGRDRGDPGVSQRLRTAHRDHGQRLFRRPTAGNAKQFGRPDGFFLLPRTTAAGRPTANDQPGLPRDAGRGTTDGGATGYLQTRRRRATVATASRSRSTATTATTATRLVRREQ